MGSKISIDHKGVGSVVSIGSKIASALGGFGHGVVDFLIGSIHGLQTGAAYIGAEDKNMENISEYDERQLMLMLEHLTSFEKKQINLSSLIGSLEFLLNALEVVDTEWEEDLLKEITTLETTNALAIIKESGEQLSEIQEDETEILIKSSTDKLKAIVLRKLK